MGRRRFDHLVVELSVALERRVPRYALWLELHERGVDPEQLGREDAIAFCREGLEAFLAARGWALGRRARRRLEREIARFQPALPTPYERMERFGARGA